MPIEGREGNQRWIQTEERVAAVLKSLPYVADVIFSAPDTPTFDLQVVFSPDQCDFPLPFVYVQVKSSSQHLASYRQENTPDLSQISHTLSWKDTERIRRDHFAGENIVLLNGGIRRDKKKKTKRVVPDETIIRNFERQARYIVDFKHSRDQEES